MLHIYLLFAVCIPISPEKKLFYFHVYGAYECKKKSNSQVAIHSFGFINS